MQMSLADISRTPELEQEAKQRFMKNDYADALLYFEELKELYPQEPEYRYFVARCLIELDQRLEDAQDDMYFAAVRGEKIDAWFYLGRAFQMNNNFPEARKAFNRFLDEGRRSDIKRLNVARNLNAMGEMQKLHAEGTNTASADKESAVKENKLAEIQSLENKNNVPEKQPVKAPAEVSADNDRILVQGKAPGNTSSSLKQTGNTIHSQEIDNAVLRKALDLQLSSDLFKREAKTKRGELREIEDPEIRRTKAAEIAGLEKESKELQHEADNQYRNLPQDTLKPAHIELKEEINGIKVYRYINTPAEESPAGDPGKTNQAIEIPDINTPVPPGTSGSEIELQAGKPYHSGNPIPERPLVKNDLFYTVQLGVYSKKANDDAFGGLYPVFYDFISEKNVYKYYAGVFNTYAAATVVMNKLKVSGYSDCFITAFYQNTPVTLDKAGEIEYKELHQGTKLMQ